MVTVTSVGRTLRHYSVLSLVSFPQTIIIMHYNCRHVGQHDQHSKYLVWANRQRRHTSWSEPVHHRPQTLVTFCYFMSCTNQCTTGPRHLFPSVVLCLAPTSPLQAPDTCYLLLFYFLHQPVHNRPQTPVTFCCFMSCSQERKRRTDQMSGVCGGQSMYLLQSSGDVWTFRVQELCESRGGRPGLSVLTILMVSVDVQQYWSMLTHWSQFVPNMSTDIRGH